MISLAVSCQPQPQVDHFKGNTMGTFYTVHVVDVSVSLVKLQADIDQLLNEFETQLSNWRSDSWISRFNALPAHQPIPVPEHAFQVLRLALELAERSGGAFDPTISPLVDLWGFGPQRSQTIPSAGAISFAQDHVGFEKIQLNPVNRTATKRVSTVQLNCSALAKGYAVDLIGTLLHQKGIDNFLINIGGEILAHGVAASGRPWQVAVDPRSSRSISAVSAPLFSLTNQAIATSGHTQRAFAIAGQRYSHIIDPRTGHPVPAAVASATITADSCALADGLATLALILTEEDFRSILQHYPHTKLLLIPWPEGD